MEQVGSEELLRCNLARLEAVFFDLDDTLYSSTEFADTARRNAIRAMVNAGLDYPEDKLFLELQEVIREFSSNYDQHFNKLLLRIPKEAFSGRQACLLAAAAVVAYQNTKVRQLFAYDDAIDLLRRLKKVRNLVRGVITAGLTAKQAEKVVRLGLVPYLTDGAVFITEQVGITKQNAKLYLSACEKCGVSPQRAMYVGDNPKVDVDVPNSIGMITVHHKRSGKYASLKGETNPDYVINNYYDLMDILAEDFKIPVL